VAVLTTLSSVSFIDRQILSLLVQQIKADLQVGDTAMSLLMGFAYALFYTVAGVPVSRLVDSGTRRTIIAFSFTARGVFTTLSGLAASLPLLAAMRMVAGVGQAGFATSAYSLLSDYFPENRRSTAIGVYQVSIYAGSGVAFIIGGTLIAFANGQPAWVLPVVGSCKPWQFALLLAGLPGLLLAPLLFTIAEPQRQGVVHGGGAVPIPEVLGYFRSIRTAILCHNLGFALMALGGFAMGAWIPAFYIRRFGWTAAQAGVLVGATSLVAGIAGTIGGGRLADYLITRGHRDAALRIGAWGSALAVPCVAAMFFSPSPTVAIVLQVPVTLVLSACSGIGVAALHQCMPNQMRGQATALFLLLLTTIGLGLGPTLVAGLTEFVFRDELRIHWSLAIVVGLAWTLASVAFFRGRKPFLAAVDALSTPAAGVSAD
jgi:MFS family permease